MKNKKKKTKVRAKYIAARGILIGLGLILLVGCIAIATVK